MPQNVQDAWKKFHDWWKKQDHDTVTRESMPADIAAAAKTFSEALAPGFDGHTCADSCYWQSVEEIFTTNATN